MEIKKHIIALLKLVGITYLNVLGITMIMTGATEDIVWLILVGVFIVDLSPSFIKTIWRDAWCQDSHTKANQNKGVINKY